jgi:hypothetical protein
MLWSKEGILPAYFTLVSGLLHSRNISSILSFLR